MTPAKNYSRYLFRAALIAIIGLSFFSLMNHHHEHQWTENDCPVCAFVVTFTIPFSSVIISVFLVLLSTVAIQDSDIIGKLLLPNSYKHRAPPILP
jgi:hypothetical protein